MRTTTSPAEVRTRLLADRAETVRRIDALTGDIAAVVEASADVATDDEHDPEGATIAFERARVGALVDQARDQLAAIDHALRRVEDGTYGRCERCGGAIGVERLAARPVAVRCIACATT